MIDPELVAAILSIVVIDLVLSGDNAVVIGMAASHLPTDQRRRAILLGAAGAVGLRVLFTALVSVLLGIPLLQFGGGVLLVWIAIKLVRPSTSGHADVSAASTQWQAVQTIVLADVVMSLDNILAVGGAARGELWLLLFGLALSVPLITVGSGAVAWALGRMPWLMWLGAGVLAWAAGQMMVEDPIVHQYLAVLPAADWTVPILALTIVIGGGLLRRRFSANVNRDGAARDNGDDLVPPAAGEPPDTARSAAR